MKNQRFAIFSDNDVEHLEKRLNEFATQLPSTAKIRRTQLAQSHNGITGALRITALVNYEVDEKEVG